MLRLCATVAAEGTILWRLSGGPMPTSELRRSIPEITERMLIRHLHELVQDGVLDRIDERSLPPCVRYSISKYGKTLISVVRALSAWAEYIRAESLHRGNQGHVLQASDDRSVSRFSGIS
jgi:DNA-binding HxlR family transcriptional regulator